MNGFLTVEIHDVTPAASEEVRAISSALERIGVTRPALLVIPEFEDRTGRTWPLSKAPEMVKWLRAEQRRGTEIVLHGLRHRAPRVTPPGVTPWLMHHGFSRGVDEFAYLTEEEAEERLMLGRRILSDLEIDVDGFIAPAWQQSPGAQTAVAALGFTYTAFFHHVRFLETGLEVRAPVLTFAAPGAVANHGKRLFMRLVEATAHSQRVIRFALHPEDVHDARTLSHEIERLRALLGSRTVVSYREWRAMSRAAA